MVTIPPPYKRYNGGKAGHGTYHQIINRIPSMDVYAEIFVGNGGVLRNLILPDQVFISDLNSEVIDKWRKITEQLELDKQIQCTVESGIDVMKRVDHYGKSAFIYADPPYMFRTRKSDKPLYKYEWTENQHKEFLTMANNSKCAVMISHPVCTLYVNRLKGWHAHDFQSMTSHGLMWDRIWMNYPPQRFYKTTATWATTTGNGRSSAAK